MFITLDTLTWLYRPPSFIQHFKLLNGIGFFVTMHVITTNTKKLATNG